MAEIVASKKLLIIASHLYVKKNQQQINQYDFATLTLFFIGLHHHPQPVVPNPEGAEHEKGGQWGGTDRAGAGGWVVGGYA